MEKIATRADQIRVLVVDDAADSRRALRQALSLDRGICVIAEAGSGEEAVELVNELNPDVVLMDIRMPGRGGIEATRAIRDGASSTRVVALTAHEDAENVRQMLSAGATGYVVKGAPLDHVVAAVYAARKGETLLDSRVMPVALDDLRRLLKEERERRLESDRLARMREEFVHVIAHELRSPLTVMVGTLRFLENRAGDGEAAELIKAALGRADHLEYVIEGLEMIGEEIPESVSANPRISATDALGRLGVVPQGQDTPDEIWHGVAPRALSRIVYELVDNAVRHGRDPIHVRARREGAWGVVTVTDSGDLDPSVDLLSAFTQDDMSTTRQIGGLGLGLFIAMRLAEAMGGRLELRREGSRTVAEATLSLR